LALVALAVFAAAGCGEDEPKPVKVTATSSQPPTGFSTYRAEAWGYSLRYDAADYELNSNESRSTITLGPSLFTGKPVHLSRLPTLDTSFALVPADEGVANPSLAIATQRPPFSVGDMGEGLGAWIRDDLLEQIGTTWGDLLTDEPRLTEIGGVAGAWTFEAVGFDEAAAAELHLRATVVAFGEYIYTLRVSAPRESWDEVEPGLAELEESFAIDAAGDPPRGPVRRTYANEKYGFSLEVPEGMVNAQEGDDPSPDLTFGVQFDDVSVSPLVALSVGVTAAPEGIGNSQSGLLEKFYRNAAEQLEEQPGVTAVAVPQEVDLRGGAAWMLDVTRKQADGSELRTRTYDIWHNDYVYSIIACGRADEWAADWEQLEPGVLSFDVD
jgi:hypothetical protein